MTHLIKINYTDGNEVITRINGTEKEIYTHYRENNFFNWCSNIESTQAKRIEFIESPLKDNRCKSLVYLFIDYDNNGLLQ
jgi:hypothetical protein